MYDIIYSYACENVLYRYNYSRLNIKITHLTTKEINCHYDKKINY